MIDGVQLNEGVRMVMHRKVYDKLYDTIFTENRHVQPRNRVFDLWEEMDEHLILQFTVRDSIKREFNG